MKGKYTQKMLEKSLIRQVTTYGILYYSLVLKESQSKILQNKRLIVLQQSDNTIFYTKKIPTKPYTNNATVPSGKVKVKIGEIKTKFVENSPQLMIVLQKQGISWSFTFHSCDIASKFVDLIQTRRQKIFQQSIYRKSRKSTASMSSIFSKQLSINKSISPLKRNATTISLKIEQIQNEKTNEAAKIMKSINSEVKLNILKNEKY